MNWQAKWIGIDNLSQTKNCYLYLRKKFKLKSLPQKALLYSCADSRYILFLNGCYLGRGPARYFPENPVYDIYDITDNLIQGDNVLAVILHYFGEDNYIHYSLGSGGYLLQLELTYNDGHKEIIGTDKSWQVKKAPWSDKSIRLGVQMGFNEIFDARKEPRGWKSINFNDSKWASAIELAPAINGHIKKLIPREIPRLREELRFPAKVLNYGITKPKMKLIKPEDLCKYVAGEKRTQKRINFQNIEGITGYNQGPMLIPLPPKKETAIFCTLDFGKEVVGNIYLDLEAESGAIIDISHSELVDEENKVVFRLKAVKSVDRYICRKGRQTWTTFALKGFRYLQLTFRNFQQPIKVYDVGVNFTTYPVNYRGSFRCSDKLLNRIWAVGRYTLELCMHDAYEDCPWREQVQWWGDARIEALVNYYTFGDFALIKRGLKQIAQTQRKDGAVMAFAPLPSDSKHCLVEYCALWVISIYEYYLFSGDKELVKELYPKIIKVMAYFEQHSREDGLLEEFSEWCLIDWAPLDKRGVTTGINCFYLMALEKAISLADLLQDNENKEKWQNLSPQITKSLNNYTWSKEKQLYYDWRKGEEKSATFSQQTQVLALLAKVVPKNKIKTVLKSILAPTDDMTKIATPYFMFYALNMLFAYGKEKEVLRIISEKWGEMLKAGATTWWEHFNSENSLCHAWSSGPTYFLSSEILGVKPFSPGFKPILIEPRPVNLSWAQGTVPTINGDIQIQWEHFIEEKMFKLEVNFSKVLPGIIKLPIFSKKKYKIWIDGKEIKNKNNLLKKDRENLIIGLNSFKKKRIYLQYQ